MKRGVGERVMVFIGSFMLTGGIISFENKICYVYIKVFNIWV